MTDSGLPDASTRMACAFCRRRKLKCDRQRPKCHSCQRFGFECEYAPGTSKGNSRTDPRTSKVRQLESRLVQMENLLSENRQQPSPAITTSSCLSSSGISENKEADEEADGEDPLDADTIKALEKLYFEFNHPFANTIHPGRYAQSRQNADTNTPIYLRQSLWALAASISEEYSIYAESLYHSSRRYLQEAELKDRRLDRLSLAHAQTWILMAFYELNHGFFHRAWLSTSRAVKLVQMLRLHRIDGPTYVMDPGLNLISPPKDITEAEERRRIFWITFLLDRYSCVSMGFPTLIDERDIRTYLPVSNKAFEDSIIEPTSYLSDAVNSMPKSHLSSLAAHCVIASICASKLGELHRFDPAATSTASPESIWLNPQRLNNPLTTVFRVPQHLSVPPSSLDSSTGFLTMATHAGTISLHRFAQSQTSPDAISEELVTHSKKICLEAALNITSTMKMCVHWDLRSFHPLTAFCLFQSAITLANSLILQHDDALATSFRFLIESIEALKKATPLCNILIEDLKGLFPSLTSQLDLKTPGSSTEDFLDLTQCSSTEKDQEMSESSLSTISQTTQKSFSNGTGWTSTGLGDFDLFYDGASTWDVDITGTSRPPT